MNRIIKSVIGVAAALTLTVSSVPFSQAIMNSSIVAYAEELTDDNGKCGDSLYYSFDAASGALTISGTGDYV